MKKAHRILPLFLALSLLLLSLPLSSLAEDNYNVTIHFMEVRGNAGSVSVSQESNYVRNTVQFVNVPGSTQLGRQGTVALTSEGLIKSRDFLGWSNVNKSSFHLSAESELFSATETIADVFGSQTSGEKTLYAYYDGFYDEINLVFFTLPSPNRNINKHKYLFIYEDIVDVASAEAFFNNGFKVKT